MRSVEIKSEREVKDRGRVTHCLFFPRSILFLTLRRRDCALVPVGGIRREVSPALSEGLTTG